MNDSNRSGYAILSAMVGGAIWIALAISALFGNRALDLLALLLLLAALVLVPLGLDLLSSADGNPAVYRLARFLQPFGAVAAAASFFVPAGTLAGVLASGWLVVTGLAGLAGLARIPRGGFGRIEESAITVALLYLPVGGAWLVAARLGMAPLGFGGVIAFLTAIHFHYAGFMAPLLAGMGGRTIQDGEARGLYRVAAAGIIAGPPLVALGITLSPAVEVVSAVVLAACVTLFALITLRAIAPSLAGRRARLLLGVSAVASVVAMLFALLYATSSYLERTLISIPQMAIAHGSVNALFALAGVLAWSAVRPAAAPARST